MQGWRWPLQRWRTPALHDARDVADKAGLDDVPLQMLAFSMRIAKLQAVKFWNCAQVRDIHSQPCRGSTANDATGSGHKL